MGHVRGRWADILEIHKLVAMGPTGAARMAYLQRAENEAGEVVAAHRVEVDAVAAALLEHERLKYEQVAQIAQTARASE